MGAKDDEAGKKFGKRLLRHMAPALAAISVWLFKLLALSLAHAGTPTKRLEVLMWSMVSATMGCFWRVFTDSRTLATGVEAKSHFTEVLLAGERFACLLLLGFLLLLCGSGPATVIQHWSAQALRIAFLAFPAYLFLGLVLHCLYNRELSAVATEEA